MTATSGDFRIEDIEYLRHGDQPLLGRLYRPAGKGPYPAVIEVHGGAWRNGDRFNNVVIAERLARRGILVFSVDFRVPPAAPYPASLEDVNFAIRWMKSRAGQFGFDPDRLGGLGTSSGGHQIMLSALRPDDPLFLTHPLDKPGHDATLHFVAVCWGILDTVERYRMANAKGMQHLVEAHHVYFGTDTVRMAEGSPQHTLEQRRFTRLPPALLIQGTNDGNIHHSVADRFADTYRQAGGQVELHKYEDAIHSFIVEHPDSPAALDAIDRIATFILTQSAR